MNCQAWIKDARRKGSGKPRWKPVALFPMREAPPNTVLCGGHITVTVSAQDEPDWGTIYARFDVEAKCDKCGNTAHPTVPSTSEAISVIITEWVERQ